MKSSWLTIAHTPVIRIKKTIRPQNLELRQALEREWRDADSHEPRIYVSGPDDGPLELYVVWSRWNGVPSHDRSEIILDAFSAVEGEENLTRVVLALGLTPEEYEAQGYQATELKS